ncbi:Nicastrin-domain-containing protein [Fimicolochytrium jonesii]|uniref:Nicastrin-domain-containing protein n=1 Tax=Fimicolochytrium jonesii TaxID=1396493 RepID=UPI0022FDFED2|nr:Nicastrin-domain-containing protein [Fimicolochytrium jonesii]KAI8825998.1 Nicastrin-domain-containing protein [Fimicolochytrium jonesii]
MYQGVPVAGCLRHLSSDGSVGCQTQPSTTGILYKIEDQPGLDSFITDAPKGKYAVVMPYSVFIPANVIKLRQSGKLAGIILVKSGLGFQRPSAFSVDETCPNCKYGLYGRDAPSSWHQWNPNGNSIAYHEYDFPIFGIMDVANASQSVPPIETALQANAASGYSSFPLYAVEFDAFMYGAQNTETCLRRDTCRPVGGVSVWASMPSYINKTDDRRPIIIVSSKMDSRAMINDWGLFSSSPVFSIGAKSSKTGLVTVMAIADAISKHLQNATAPLVKDLIFTFFDAESWAFAGSERFVEDIIQPVTCKEKNGATSACPVKGNECSNPCYFDLDFNKIKWDNIEGIVEFDTIGATQAGGADIYMHVDAQNAATNSLAATFAGTYPAAPYRNSSVTSVNLQAAAQNGVNNRLPPSSVMAFLKRKSIPAVVISDYKDAFSNQFYNTEFDDATTLDDSTVSAMCAVASAAASSLYANAIGNITKPNVTADCGLISDMMFCFTQNLSCPLLTPYYPEISKFHITQESTYAGIFDYDTSVLAYVINRFMTDRTATNVTGVCLNDNDCDVSQCVLGFSRYHWAYGTGLQMNYGTSQFGVVDPAKGTWVQSTYRDYGGVRMRVFLVQSSLYQGMQLGVGLALTLLSIGVLFSLRVYSKRRFKSD